ncbi:MAG: hypothetical protein ACKOWF_02070 [Chloroflexota bacterium]
MGIQFLDTFTATTGEGVNVAPSTTISVTTTSASFQFQVAMVYCNANATASTPIAITPPSGWTNLTSFGGGNGANVQTAVLSYSLPNTIPNGGTFTWTFPSAVTAVVVLTRYNDLTTFNTSAGALTTQSPMYSAQVTPGTGQRLFICGFGQRQRAVALTGFELRTTGTAGGQAGATLVGALTNRAGTNGARAGNSQQTDLEAYVCDTIVTTSAGFYNGQATTTSNQQGAALIASFGFNPSLSKVPSIF